MANVCPNTSSQAWRDLVNRFGEDITWSLYVRAGDNIPPLRQALETVKSMNITYEPISIEEKMTLGVVDKNGKPVVYRESKQQYEAARNKAMEINANYGPYRAKVVPSASSPRGKEYSEVYVERYVLPEDSKPDLSAYSIKPEEAFQLSNESSREPIKGLDGLLKKWAGMLGFQVKDWDTITGKDGKPIEAIAKVDMVRKVITVAMDKADASTLSEECAHIAVRMLGEDHPLYERLMNTVRNSVTYDKVLQEYGESYGNDTQRLEEEAAGKLIAQEVIRLWDENGEEYVTENNKVVSALKRIWNRIMSFFKTKAQVANLTVDQMNLDMQPFTEVAQMMLKKQITGLDNLTPRGSDDVYYELSSEMVATQIDVEDFLKNIAVHYNEKTGQYIRSDGHVVGRRVSDIVSRGMRRRFKITSDKEADDKLPLATLKGTTIHTYLQLLMNDRISGSKSTARELNRTVARKLMTLPELEGKSEEFARKIAYLDEAQIEDLNKAIDGIYKEILSRQAYIDKQTGTKGDVKIFTEHIIYDEERDLAGTCDLVVVYSNGVIDIYDYKTHEFTEEKGEIVSDIRESTRDAWNIQLVQYKNIYTNGIRKAAEAAGRKVNVTFGATRMLPINVQYNFYSDSTTKEKNIHGLRKIQPWNNEVRVLRPVSLAEEQDLDPKLSAQLEKLYQTSNAQRARYERTKSQIDFDAYTKTQELIQNIVVNKDYAYLYTELKSIAESLDRRLTIPLGQPGSLTANEILELKQRMDVYLNFLRGTSSLEDTNIDLNTRLEHGKAIRDALYIQDLLTSKPVDMMLQMTGEDITQPGQHVSWFGGWFSKLSEINHPIFRAFSKLLKSAQARVHDQLGLAYEKITAAHNALEKWAKEKGSTLQNEFNRIVDTDTGNLINKYSTSYYQDLEKAREKKTRNVAFFLNNYEIERGPRGSGFRYTGKALQAFNNAVKDWQTRLKNAEGTSDYEREQRRYTSWRISNDLEFNKNALYDKRNVFIRDKYRKENSEYYSDAYKKIMNDQPLVDYYNMYVRFNVQFEEITGRPINSRFIANVRNDLMDSIFKNGVGALGDIRSIALASLETRDESDTLYKSKNETSGKDYEGNPIKHVPLFYIDPLRDNLTKEDVAAAEAAIDPKIKEGTDDWTIAKNNELRKIAEKKGLRHKSYDLSRVLLLMAQSVYTYQHMKEIEANAQLLLYHARTDNAKVYNEDNLPNMDKWNGKVGTSLGLSSNDISTLEKFIDLYIYGKTLQGEQKTFNFMGKSYTPGKLARKVVQWSALSTLGFKPILGFRAYAQNYINYKLNQSEGVYFDKRSSKEAEKLKRKDPLKYNAIMEFFHITNKDIWRMRGNELSANRANRIFNSENAFWFLEKADTAFDNKVLASMLYAWGYDEKTDKIVKISRVKDAIPLADLIHVDLETGKVTIDKLSQENIVKFRSIAQSAATAIKGVMPAEDGYLAGTTVAGILVMQYRNWLPGLLKARFKGLSKDLTTDEYDIGRFRVGLGEFAGGAQEMTKAFGRMLIRSLPIIGYMAGENLGFNEAAARKRYEDYFKTHPNESKLDFTFEDFCNLHVQKLKAFAYELQSIVGLFLAAMLAKALVPDEPEDDFTGWATKIGTQNLYRALYGAYLEASFFVDLKSATDIMSSPFASLSWLLNLQRFFSNTVDETRDFVAGKDYKGMLWWEEDSNDKTPSFYFTSRLLPGVNAAQDFFDIFDTFTFNQR